MARLLLIDDDVRLGEILRGYLEPHGFTLQHAEDGGRGLAQLDGGGFDAVLLDVMMPGMDGLDVLRRIRERRSNIPVVMLTARGDESDRIVGLELGADDYLGKPFSSRELLARLRAVLRRAGPDTFADKVQVGDVVVDAGARTALRAGRSIELTALELDLLLALMRRAGRAVPRDALLSDAGRADVVVGDRTVDVHVSHLRSKLGEPSPIRTVRGVGYLYAKEGT
ncbi:MAG: response regulator transcription factor [Deltaproteobacteria bacterium]|nr:response regulator transcription factor [Deltaproteobacteria bacterium]